MDVSEVLKAISSGEHLLELKMDRMVTDDVVIYGAVSEKTNPSGFGRHEFAFRGEQQDELLNGLSEIINKSGPATWG